MLACDSFSASPKRSGQKVTNKYAKSSSLLSPVLRRVSKRYVFTRTISSDACTRVSAVFDKEIGKSARLAVTSRAEPHVDIYHETTSIVLGTFHHPVLPKMYDVFEDDLYFFVETELMPADLSNLLKQGCISFSEKKEVFWHLLKFLKWLDEKDLVHRGISTDAVYFAEGDVVHPKIVDVSHVLKIREHKKYFEEGVGCDAPYRAPELMRPCKGWEMKRSDVYSVACVAYEMFYGKMGSEKAMRKRKAMEKSQNEEYQQLHLLMSGMLEHDVRLRLSALEAICHPFFRDSD